MRVRVGVAWLFDSRARVCTHELPEFLIFCCHKCHSILVFGGEQKKNLFSLKGWNLRVKYLFCWLISELCSWGCCISLKYSRLSLFCDTCDSKKCEIPVVCAYACARRECWSMPFCRKERFATNWFVNSFLYQNKLPCTCVFSTDGSFVEKWRVVCRKMTGRFAWKEVRRVFA